MASTNCFFLASSKSSKPFCHFRALEPFHGTNETPWDSEDITTKIHQAMNQVLTSKPWKHWPGLEKLFFLFMPFHPSFLSKNQADRATLDIVVSTKPIWSHCILSLGITIKGTKAPYCRDNLLKIGSLPTYLQMLPCTTKFGVRLKKSGFSRFVQGPPISDSKTNTLGGW